MAWFLIPHQIWALGLINRAWHTYTLWLWSTGSICTQIAGIWLGPLAKSRPLLTSIDIHLNYNVSILPGLTLLIYTSLYSNISIWSMFQMVMHSEFSTISVRPNGTYYTINGLCHAIGKHELIVAMHIRQSCIVHVCQLSWPMIGWKSHSAFDSKYYMYCSVKQYTTIIWT